MMDRRIAERREQVDINREALAKDIILTICTHDNYEYTDYRNVRKSVTFAGLLYDTFDDALVEAVHERFPFIDSDFFETYRPEHSEYCLVTLALKSELVNAVARSRLARNSKFQLAIYDHFLAVTRSIAGDIDEMQDSRFACTGSLPI